MRQIRDTRRVRAERPGSKPRPTRGARPRSYFPRPSQGQGEAGSRRPCVVEPWNDRSSTGSDRSCPAERRGRCIQARLRSRLRPIRSDGPACSATHPSFQVGSLGIHRISIDSPRERLSRGTQGSQARRPGDAWATRSLGSPRGILALRSAPRSRGERRPATERARDARNALRPSPLRRVGRGSLATYTFRPEGGRTGARRTGEAPGNPRGR